MTKTPEPNDRHDEVEVALRYINRVRSMMPSDNALADLDQQEAELLQYAATHPHPTGWSAEMDRKLDELNRDPDGYNTRARNRYRARHWWNRRRRPAPPTTR